MIYEDAHFLRPPNPVLAKELLEAGEPDLALCANYPPLFQFITEYGRQRKFFPFHLSMCKVADLGSPKSWFLAPRGTYKTEVSMCREIVRQSVHCHPELYSNPFSISIFSWKLEVAKEMIARIKRIIMCKDLIQDYPWALCADKNQYETYNQDDIVLKNGVRIEAFSLESLPTGRHFGQSYVDDPTTIENARTREGIRGVGDQFDQLNYIVSPGGRTWGSGTIYHFADLNIQIINDPAWTVFRRAAMEDEQGRPDMNGMPTCPEIWSREALIGQLHTAKLRGKTEMFYNQMQLQPTAPETQPFKNIQLVFTPPTSNGIVTVTLDPAVSEKDNGDFSAFTVVRSVPEPGFGVRRYVIHACQERGWVDMDPLQQVKRLVDLCQSFRAHQCGIEAVAYQRALKAFVQEEIRKRGMNVDVDQFVVGVKGRFNNLSKEEYAKGLVPYFNSGQMVVDPRLTELVDQLKHFPRGKHDDLVDSLAMHPELPAWKWAQSLAPLTYKERSNLAVLHTERTEMYAGNCF